MRLRRFGLTKLLSASRACSMTYCALSLLPTQSIRFRPADPGWLEVMTRRAQAAQATAALVLIPSAPTGIPYFAVLTFTRCVHQSISLQRTRPCSKPQACSRPIRILRRGRKLRRRFPVMSPEMPPSSTTSTPHPH